MMRRNNCNPAFIRVFATALLVLGQAAVAGPGRPGPIKVSEVSANSALIQWSASDAGEGSQVIYEVQFRSRLDGGRTEWYAAAKAIKTGVTVDGLKPVQLYEVRVRGWVDNVAGPWQIKEHAFTTLSGDEDSDQDEQTREGEGDEAGLGLAKKTVEEIKRIKAAVEAGNITQEEADAKIDALLKLDDEGREEGGGEGGKEGEGREDEERDGEAGVLVIAEIKADDIGPRAGVAKWDLVHEMDAKVGYDVQIRTRVEGKAGEWRHEAETVKNSIIIDGLKPDTLYEIRVRPWANKKAGEWKVLENAFRTRKGDEGDGGDGDGNDGEGEKGDGGDAGESPKAPSQPGVIKVSKVTPNSALIQWGASKAPSDAKAVYAVQIRQRLVGKPTEWRYVGETIKTEFAVGKLEPGTLYEVRVCAWANKTPGQWQIKEHAFTTGGGEGEQTIDHAGHIDFQVIPGDKMRLTWPAGKGRFVVESSDSIGNAEWMAVEIRPVQVSQVMVVDLSIAEAGMRFFRVRN